MSYICNCFPQKVKGNARTIFLVVVLITVLESEYTGLYKITPVLIYDEK